MVVQGWDSPSFNSAPLYFVWHFSFEKQNAILKLGESQFWKMMTFIYNLSPNKSFNYILVELMFQDIFVFWMQ